MKDIAVFAPDGIKTAPGGSTISDGYLPDERLPASNQNYYLNAFSLLIAEGVSVLDAAGITPNAAVDNQLLQSINILIGNAVIAQSWKAPVIVATTANITLSGEQTIDGILTSASRVLVKNQTDAKQNGIYVSAAGAWSRSTDADVGSEIVAATTIVEQGTVGAQAQWTNSNTSITIGVTNITFVKTPALLYSAGTNLTLTGNVFSLPTTLTGSLLMTGVVSMSPDGSHIPVLPSAFSAVVNLMNAADAANTVHEIQAYGATANTLYNRINGTPGAKTAITNAQVIGGASFTGWDGSAVNYGAKAYVQAGENWSGSTTASEYLIAVSKHNDPGVLTTGMQVSGFNSTVYIVNFNFQVTDGHAYFSHDVDVSGVLWASPGLKIAPSVAYTFNVPTNTDFGTLSIAAGVNAANTVNGTLEIRQPGGIPGLFFNRLDGTNASPTAVQSGDVVGQVLFGGYDGSSVYATAGIKAVAGETWVHSGDVRGTDLSFNIYLGAGPGGGIVQMMRMNGHGGVFSDGKIFISNADLETSGQVDLNDGDLNVTNGIINATNGIAAGFVDGDNITVTSGGVLQLGNAAAVGVAIASTHTLTVKDSTGTVYKLLAHT